MITSFLVAAIVATSCPPTRLVDSSGLGITEEDRQLVQGAEVGCEENFADIYPCAVLIEKIGPKNFQVSCGAKVEQESI